jgi:EAL domain-containing protein (putative c-di-GMP-specific phosphodiesterase class I)
MTLDGTKARIVVADDDAALLGVVERQLTKCGHEVEAVPDGRAAIALLAQKRFDVLLSDLSMPGMNGIELLRAVRTHDLDLSVVIMTGTPDLNTAVKAIEHGALRYLIKPVTRSELLATVDDAIRFCRLARAKREALALLGSDEGIAGDRAGLDVHFTRALDGVWMALQPIVRWSTKEVHSHELLLRTSYARFVSPNALLSAAERLGRLFDLGRTVRNAVARTASRMRGQTLFMNLHARDLQDEDLFAADAPLTAFAGDIVLEITERASLDEITDASSRLERLRAMGYRIALDDLGAGYAGLSSLAQLRPEIVKLDMSLIRGVDQDVARQKLVGAMVNLSRDLGKLVVIEGVETAGERDALVRLGGDLFQGFLFARPTNPASVVVW